MKKKNSNVYGIQKVMQNLYKINIKLNTSDFMRNMTMKQRSNLRDTVKTNEMKGNKMVGDLFADKLITQYQRNRMIEDMNDIVSKNRMKINIKRRG